MKRWKGKTKEEVGEIVINDRRYTYLRDNKCPTVIQSHQVVVRTSNAKVLFGCVFALILLPNFFIYLKEPSVIFHLWSVVVTAFLFKLMLRNRVIKESVVIMPAFGVQLETHFVNGRIIRRFVPINKILKPVLLERVTPVTCYWTLSLILSDEQELMLVFKELRPPVKMLVHIWKALCMASGNEDSLESFADHTQY